MGRSNRTRRRLEQRNRRKLEAADLILLLVSSAFLNSTYCYDKEMRRAVERHQAGTARVIPIALRQCYWGPAPFAKLRGLPSGMRPVTSWPKDKWDTALAEVAKGIHEAAAACATSRANRVLPNDDVRPFHVPFPRNRFFTGRDELLAALRQSLEGQGAAVSITGLGGVGKTQTALEYVYRRRDDYRVVWWIDAETTAGIDLGFTGLAKALRMAKVESASRDQVITAVRGRLERESGWLLVQDNAEQPENIRPYLQLSFAGHPLITSRNPDWDDLGEVLSLDTWPRNQSVEFLVKRSGRTDGGTADMLATELGDLPLALEQAAYIRRSGQSFAGYLALYRKRFADMAKEFPPANCPRTVLTTWEMSLAAAEQDSPVAGDLLCLLAFLAPDDIPRALLTEHFTLLPAPLAEAIKDGIAFDRAVTALHSYSLTKVTPDTFAPTGAGGDAGTPGRLCCLGQRRHCRSRCSGGQAMGAPRLRPLW